jgi:hypothetical protein
MSGITRILLFMVSCVLTHNFIFSRFLGCCPFLGVSRKVGVEFCGVRWHSDMFDDKPAGYHRKKADIPMVVT